MVIDESARKTEHFLSRRIDLRLPRRERIADQRVRIGDVEIAIEIGDSKRRIEMVDEDCPELRTAVAVGIAKQGDPLRRRWAGLRDQPSSMRQAHDEAAHRNLGPVDRLRSRDLRFDHEDVAVRERIDGARIGETGGERLDSEARRDRRRFTGFPSDDSRDRDFGEDSFLWRRKHRVRPDGLRRVGIVAAAAGGERKQRDEGEQARPHARLLSAGARASQPVTSARRPPTIDKTNPVGTTAVQPSRAWTSELNSSSTSTMNRSNAASQLSPRAASISIRTKATTPNAIPAASSQVEKFSQIRLPPLP